MKVIKAQLRKNDQKWFMIKEDIKDLSSLDKTKNLSYASFFMRIFTINYFDINKILYFNKLKCLLFI